MWCVRGGKGSQQRVEGRGWRRAKCLGVCRSDREGRTGKDKEGEAEAEESLGEAPVAPCGSHRAVTDDDD